MPTAACFARDSKQREKKRTTLAEKSALLALGRISTPLEAMMASFACEGKRLRGPDGGDAGSTFREAYDADDCRG